MKEGLLVEEKDQSSDGDDPTGQKSEGNSGKSDYSGLDTEEKS